MPPLQYGPQDWQAIEPVLTTAAAGLVVLLGDLIVPRALRRATSLGLTILGLIVAGIVTANLWGTTISAFGGAYITGGFTLAFEGIILTAALLAVLTGYGLGREEQSAGACALLLWGVSGAQLMAGATDLMTIFLGIEVLSLALYCLCGFSMRSVAREAALKYLILSSAASGFMLYGMALLFGATGSIALSALLAPTASHALLVVGIALFLVGLAFKLSLVPFHVWTPDVFEGAPLTVTAFMSVVTKAGTLAVLARLLYAALPQADAQTFLVPLWWAAGLSMIVGNLAALAQTDLKRLLAYSGIAQIGYVIAAFAGITASGLSFALFYLAAYTFMNLGAFAVLSLLSRSNDEGSRLSALAGLGYRRPVLAAAMLFFLLGLAGLPPTAGFTGKIAIVANAFGAGYPGLAAVLIVGTAISIYAYMKIARAMYARTVRAPGHPVAIPLTPLPWVGVAVCAVAVVLLGLYPLFPSGVLPVLK